MSALPEHSWKHRFTQRLARAFMAQGLKADSALEDAIAHAEDHYPARGSATPEEEADALHRILLADRDQIALSPA